MKCQRFVAGPEPKPEFKGDTRTYRVQLDCNQYQKDMMDIVKGHEVGCHNLVIDCNWETEVCMLYIQFYTSD